MTYEQGIRIATRAIAVYLFAWAVSDAIDLPHIVIHLRHYLQLFNLFRSDGLGPQEPSVTYFLRVYAASLASTILRISLWLLAARWFYQCGPQVQRYFGLSDSIGEQTN